MLDRLVEKIDNLGGNTYLCAGTCRDIILGRSPRDIDVCIEGIKKEDFDNTIASVFDNYAKNRYGGYNIPEAKSLDVWQLENMPALKHINDLPTIETMLRSFVINLNSVAINIKTQEIIDNGAIEGIRSRIIDFCYRPLLHDESTFAAKGILLADRLGFKRSPRFTKFCKDYYDEPTFNYEYNKIYS